MKCVLILEDEPLIAIDLQFACEDLGLRSVTAADCGQALEAYGLQAFDGAILDVNLGKGETCEAVVRRLRADGIPFILHTGDLNRVGEYLREVGAPIVAKPSPAETVVERLLALA